MRDAGFLLQCVHCSGNAGHPERIFGSSRVGGLFLGHLAFFSLSLDSVCLGVAFSGLLSGSFLLGAVVGFGLAQVARTMTEITLGLL